MATVKETTITGRLTKNGDYVNVTVSDGMISAISPAERSRKESEGTYLIPGLIDIQVNGYDGIDFSDPGLTLKLVGIVTKSLYRQGVTTFLPTLVTCAPEILKANLVVLSEAVQEDTIGQSIPGFHLEGPYINPEEGFRGAHDKQWIRLPDWEEFMDFYRASGNGIKMITLAPELRGAVKFIEKAVEMGIVVALGHHNANSKQIREAVEAGASLSTHLGNGCANMIHRHNNPLWAQLANEKLSASLIADGFHLSREEIKTFVRAKGIDKIILISDMTKLAGKPPGNYEWGAIPVTLTPEGSIIYREQGVLAGSTVSLHKDIGNMIAYTSCTPDDAIRAATRNPAELIGLKDRGMIEKRRRADFVLAEFANNVLTVKQCFIKGKMVYSDQPTENYSGRTFPDGNKAFD